MTCAYPTDAIEKTIAFHGHSCPGVAIGIRVAEYAKREFPDTAIPDLVCVTETDMCGVDAIQYLTGCTFGKGNLIHRDFGKIAFSFFDRKAQRGIRLVLRPESRGSDYKKMTELMGKNMAGELDSQAREQLSQLRTSMQHRMMSLPLEDLFTLQVVEFSPPRKAKILQSLICQSCGEQTMESRTRRFDGRTLCIPCYQQVEQKI